MPPRHRSSPIRRRDLWAPAASGLIAANALLGATLPRWPARSYRAGAGAGPGEGQIRALWVDAFHDGVKTVTQIDRLIDDALGAGVNTLIVQVRRRGDAYYNRTDEPRTEDPTLQRGLDALQLTIDRVRAANAGLARAGGARAGLEVHAWIATVPIWNRKDRPPADPRHAFNRHGPDAQGEASWISLDDKGEAWDGDNYSLDPGHPDAARYIAEVAAEIVRAYDVDGIHLDLIRYAGVQWGYNPVSVDRFRRSRGGSGPPAASDARWQQWRRDQVTALVRRIYLDTLAVKPRLKVSAATIGWGSGPVDDRGWRNSSAYRNVFQDWVGWAEDGIVDVVMPMNYDDDRIDAQRRWFDQWTDWQRKRRGQRHVVAGVGLFLNEPAAGLAQIRRALEPSRSGDRLDGVALYSYAVSNAPARGESEPETPNVDFLRSLVEPSAWGGDAAPPFAQPAAPPAMPWKDSPGAHVRGLARRLTPGLTSEAQALDGATVRLAGPASIVLQTDGNGYFGAAGLRPGRYTVSVDAAGATVGQSTVELRAGEVLNLDLIAV
jgi:uncharacterized lipoprotein YddW (UPF0748 family)